MRLPLSDNSIKTDDQNYKTVKKLFVSPPVTNFIHALNTSNGTEFLSNYKYVLYSRISGYGYHDDPNFIPTHNGFPSSRSSWHNKYEEARMMVLKYFLIKWILRVTQTWKSRNLVFSTRRPHDVEFALYNCDFRFNFIAWTNFLVFWFANRRTMSTKRGHIDAGRRRTRQ